MAALAVSEPDRGELLQTLRAVLLTPRQAEVVKLAQRGLAAKEIARQLGISKRTVEAHLGEARRRVGAVSTVALVGSVIVGARAIDSESSHSCSENAGISEQVITGGVPSPPRPGRRRRGRPTVMTDDMIAKARLLLPSHSISDIARHLKVSRTTIYAHMGQIRGMRELRGPRASVPPYPGCFLYAHTIGNIRRMYDYYLRGGSRRGPAMETYCLDLKSIRRLGRPKSR